MTEVSILDDRHLVWLLALNTLLHELGVPVPMLPTALFAGARAATGALDPLALVAAVVAGTVLGNAVWFAAGRKYGASVLKLLCRLSLSPDTCVGRTQGAFGRWGWSSLVVGRFIPGISLVAPPLAGALGMPWRKFLALTLAGASLWGLVAVGAGVLFHEEIDLVLRQLDAFGWRAAAVIAAALVLYVAWRWVQRRRAGRALEVPRIDVDSLRNMITAGELPIVVDVRGPAMQRAEPRRIPGAIALSLEEIEAALREVSRDRPIILYCACPNEASAARAAQMLLARGYVDARPLLGGLDAWIVAGHPLENAASYGVEPHSPGLPQRKNAAPAPQVGRPG